MSGSRHILLLLEGMTVLDEMLLYAIQLTRRMNAHLHVLALCSEQAPPPPEQNRIFEKMQEEIHAEGIPSHAEIRYGDKASELIKYLALSPTFTTLILGTDPEAEHNQERKKTEEHWFTRVSQKLRCPIVRPAATDLKNKRQ